MTLSPGDPVGRDPLVFAFPRKTLLFKLMVSTDKPTRRRRSKETRSSVRIADFAAAFVIRVGGIGTILAVGLVCVFLVWVAVPLIAPSDLADAIVVPRQETTSNTTPIHVGVDEYLNVVWQVSGDGTLTSWRADTGERVSEQSLFTDKQLQASAFSLRDGHVVLAYADRTFQSGTIDFATEFVPPEAIPSELKKLQPGEIASFREGVVELTPENQFRLLELNVQLDDPVEVDHDAEIVLIDQSVSSRGSIVAMLMADGQLRVAQVTKKKNLLTNKVTTRLREGTVQVRLSRNEPPKWLKLAGLGDNVLLIWEDGTLLRFDTRNSTAPVLAEKVDLTPDDDTQLTAVEYLIGKTSLVTSTNHGDIDVWFQTKPENAATPDGSELSKGHSLAGASKPIVKLAASPRSRMLAAASNDGTVDLYHVTSEQLLASSKVSIESDSLDYLLISSKDDAVLAATGPDISRMEIEAAHPEVNLKSIFGKVWYEGYEEKEHVWQSSSGTDDFEEKLGLVPLIFGTFKATFYSMLFGVPLALLAAIYTSEFLHPAVKARVKPTIEIMASLPSVVLGFLAALFFAPLVEDIVPQCLSMLVTVPFTFLLGAYLWQLFPEGIAVSMRRLRLLGMLLALPVGIALAWPVGSVVEDTLFAGDIMAWLDGQIGSGLGAWMFVFLPASCLVIVWFNVAVLTPIVRNRAGSMGRVQYAVLDLIRFLFNCLLVVATAYLLSSLFAAAGFDPRGTFVDTYVQRNALVVGFIMGFAVIPIIYTISDDALSAVPESLRGGSLGAGATQWQTAVRVVIPTAMSGLFSAIMIGLGRAVGETMIVLMAAGNTPVLDWNIFNGFRTLSANIAVELPEAVRDSTHYRMLFLAALSLFAITFVLNTVAEVVRLRFRKKAFQL